MTVIVRTKADRELEFRQCAISPDAISRMRSLSSLNININAQESDSEYTALHLASLNGNCKAIRLLFNLNADFSIVDKNEKTAEHLAKDAETAAIFKMISVAKSAVRATGLFFINALTDKNTFAILSAYMKHKNHKYQNLEPSPESKADAVFAYLAFIESIPQLIERVNSTSRVFPDSKNNVVILGRNDNPNVECSQKLEEALIIDGLSQEIFFFQEVNMYALRNTRSRIFENLNSHHFEITETNRNSSIIIRKKSSANEAPSVS